MDIHVTTKEYLCTDQTVQYKGVSFYVVWLTVRLLIYFAVQMNPQNADDDTDGIIVVPWC